MKNTHAAPQSPSCPTCSMNQWRRAQKPRPKNPFQPAPSVVGNDLRLHPATKVDLHIHPLSLQSCRR